LHAEQARSKADDAIAALNAARKLIHILEGQAMQILPPPAPAMSAPPAARATIRISAPAPAISSGAATAAPAPIVLRHGG